MAPNKMLTAMPEPEPHQTARLRIGLGAFRVGCEVRAERDGGCWLIGYWCSLEFSDENGWLAVASAATVNCQHNAPLNSHISSHPNAPPPPPQQHQKRTLPLEARARAVHALQQHGDDDARLQGFL